MTNKERSSRDPIGAKQRADDLRRVKRHKGRRSLANFENLPVTTQVYELSAEERTCPSCVVERQESGAEESWQIKYIPGHFERIHHVGKKYACVKCERSGEAPQMAVAARPESSIDKGMAGPDCWPTSWPASSPSTGRAVGATMTNQEVEGARERS